MAKIAVVGTGYVGLTTGAYLAHLGHDVTCADIVPEKVERLNRGEIPIVEPGLDEIVAGGIAENRLHFVLGAAAAAEDAEFIFLCLPTPQGEDGSADLSYVQAAAKEIAPVIKTNSVVINKSTVPVGSAQMVEEALGRSDVFVVSNPEFLREGSAVYDCLNPDRIVIGATHQEAAVRVGELFSKLQAPLLITDTASSETIKYASNAFLATKISFINAMANVCENVGADVKEVSLGMGYDKRIGFEFLRPGPGWGGSCFVGEETLLIRRGDEIRLLSFAELSQEVESQGAEGYEALAWVDGWATPEFFPISAFTRRPYKGDVIDVRTKMGRRVTVTEDHPFAVIAGEVNDVPEIKMASELDEEDWLPVVQNWPVVWADSQPERKIVDFASAGGLSDEQLILRLSDVQRAEVERRRDEVHWTRRRDILRCGTMKLSELQSLGMTPEGALVGTATNGTYVPTEIEYTEEFWFVLGLFLAEGHIGQDGDRKRICWAFHPTDEAHLAKRVSDYWSAQGVKVTTRALTTTLQVSISSRVLASWLEHGLRVGVNCYEKRIPDAIWAQPLDSRRALLAGLWEGDGSWSLLNGGPSVALEYGTASRTLADGMLRLLGDLGIVARLKVGRTAKSTVDTYWLVISGADQIEEGLWLFSQAEQLEIIQAISGQAKRIAPTGYRRHSKGEAWVRVVSAERKPFDGDVYSVEVFGPHTVVVTHGLVAHNCFPKDSHALVKIAEDAGYDFKLMKSVIEVNQEQYDMVANKIREAAGGDLKGKTIGVWGLAFKANTDDLRDSPSLYVIDRLVAAGATVKGYDITQTIAHAPKHPTLDKIEVAPDPYAAVEGADVLAVLTEWDEFRWLDLDKVKNAVASPVIVDARNLLNAVAVRRKGFQYSCVGRP